MPPKSTPAQRAQTLKQAKAAYKSRNQSTLSEREKKQIERSIELDRRAWRAKQTEKNKAEAKAKREEKERREREAGLAGGIVGMRGERRCDRFGFVGSQMHLGAFFGCQGGMDGRGAVSGQSRAGLKGEVAEKAAGAEDCFDGELDDETLLDALHEGRNESPRVNKGLLEDKPAATGEPGRAIQQAPHKLVTNERGELDLFWDDLDSSTQIARDIAHEPTTKTEAKPDSKTRSSATSFGSDEFDLSVEDIEEAQMNEVTDREIEQDKKLKPHPLLPVNPPTPAKSIMDPPTNKRSMPPPPLPAKSREPVRPPAQLKRLTTPKAISKPCSSTLTQLGFTLAELESFVDDNLQLTQAAPG